jgi:hypothetical protein
MRNFTAEAAAQLAADWPGWHSWYVPRAVGKPVFTWHARRWDGDGRYVIHASSPGELAAAIEQQEER